MTEFAAKGYSDSDARDATDGVIDADTVDGKNDGEVDAATLQGYASIPTALISDAAVTSAKVANDAITQTKIAADAVAQTQLSFDAATQTELNNHAGDATAHHTKPASTQSQESGGGYESTSAGGTNTPPKTFDVNSEVDEADGFRTKFNDTGFTDGDVGDVDIDVTMVDGTTVTFTNLTVYGENTSSIPTYSRNFPVDYVDTVKFYNYTGPNDLSISFWDLHRIALPNHAHSI